MENVQKLQASPMDDGRYRLLVESVFDYAIYMLDPDGYVSSWNNGARRFKGYEASEIVGRHFSTFYPEEDRRNGMPARALEIARREGKFEGEGWRVRKDGERFWAHVVIDPILTPTGGVIGYAKVTRDLSERREAAAELSRSEEQFRLLVQSVTDYAIYMLDENGNVSNWNAGAERIKGYSASEIVGRHFSVFYTPEDVAAGGPQRSLDTAAREGRFEKEGLRVRKDGSQFWANVVIDPIRSEAGDIIGYAKITRDITERRKAQESLDRTREELMQAQKMEAIGRLTGGVAHDFNNLLMAITGSLSILEKRLPPDPRLQPFIQNAMLGAQRGITLTQRMLAFARRQELEPKPTDLIKLVHGVLEMIQHALGPTISIKTRFPSAPQLALVDPNQLELALLNLAVNSRDAMPEGGALTFEIQSKSITGEANLPPGDYVCLAVRDTGEGMSEDTMARATEPFFTTKGVGKGTGLGLSMVRGMVDQLGGKLVLKSQPGTGATVELWFPTAAGMSVSERQDAAPAPATQKQGLVVLAVDDDRLVLMNTTAMIEELGHTPVTATSAKDALAILATDVPVDVVITDHAMPSMTGLELARILAKERPHLPVIIATGYADFSDQGSVGLLRLQKPFDLEDLQGALANPVPAAAT